MSIVTPPAPGLVAGIASPPAGTPTTEAPPPAGTDWQAEAKKAFATRDAAKDEVRTLRAELAALRAPAPAPAPAASSEGTTPRAARSGEPSDVERAVAERFARVRLESDLERAYIDAGGKRDRWVDVRDRFRDVWAAKARTENERSVGIAEAVHALREVVGEYGFGPAGSSPASAVVGSAGPPINVNNLQPGQLAAMAKDNPSAFKAVLEKLGHKPNGGMRL